MNKDIPTNQRINRIGELLAKAVYLYVKNNKEKTTKDVTDKRAPDVLNASPSRYNFSS